MGVGVGCGLCVPMQKGAAKLRAGKCDRGQAASARPLLTACNLPARPTRSAPGSRYKAKPPPPRTSCSSTHLPRSSPRVGRPQIVSISFDEFFDFTSGYQDPLYNISTCSIPPSSCCSVSTDPLRPSGAFLSSVLSSSHHGTPSADWHLAIPFSGAQNSRPLLDTSSLLSTPSSAALTGDFPPDASLYATPNWNLLPVSNSPYLGHGAQSYSGGPDSLCTTGNMMNTLAMPESLDMSSSTNTPAQMTRGETGSQEMHFQNLMYTDGSQSGASSTSHKNRSSSSQERTSGSKLPSVKSSPPGQESSSRIEKRRANTLAARRYRQKRVDQMSTLEAELKEIKAERDELKVRNARLEGEVETLRALLRSQQ